MRILILAFLILSASIAFGDWTFMVYLDGDCDLELFAIDDFLEMAGVGSDSNLNIVVQFDRTPNSSSASGYSSEYDDWADCRRGLVSSGNTPTSSWGASIGEVNMGDAATLQEFVEWGVVNYPATNYAVVLWNHGSGWRSGGSVSAKPSPVTKAVCYDETSSNDALYTSEVADAVAAAAAAQSVSIDLLGFDACLMAMLEVAYEVRNCADVMVGSEDLEPGDGWPYDTILADLKATPAMTAAALGDTIASRYYQSYSNTCTQSALDLSQINTLAIELSEFAALAVSTDDDWYELDASRAAAPYFDSSDFRDLSTFIDEYINTYGTVSGLITAAQDVDTALGNAIIANYSGISEGGTGISIYFPANGQTVDTAYIGTNIEFAADTQWDEFLAAFAAADTSLDMSAYEIVYSTDFTGGIPGTWTIVDGGQSGGFSAYSTWYAETAAMSFMSGTYALVDSDAYNDGGTSYSMDEQLITYYIDLSEYEEVVLAFDHYFDSFSGTEKADVDISINGTTWTNVAQYTNDTSGHVYLDVTALAAEQASVQFRWHYYDANYDWGWGVDNVTVYGILKPVLSVSLTAADCDEDDGTMTDFGTVSINDTLASNLDVTIISDDTGLIVPESPVTILAGQLSADFDITVTNNTDMTANDLVTLTVSASGFDDVTDTITVNNEDFDGDGLPDDWEMNYFFDLDELPDVDTDGDGYLNSEELIRHTDPSDPASYPVQPEGGTKEGCMPGSGSGLLILLAGAAIRLNKRRCS